MEKADYIRALMTTKLKAKHAKQLVDACLVYWHSGIDVSTAAAYLNHYHLKLIQSGTRD